MALASGYKVPPPFPCMDDDRILSLSSSHALTLPLSLSSARTAREGEIDLYSFLPFSVPLAFSPVHLCFIPPKPHPPTTSFRSIEARKISSQCALVLRFRLAPCVYPLFLWRFNVAAASPAVVRIRFSMC